MRTVFCLVCLVAACWAQPDPGSKPADDQSITRSELVTEFDGALDKLERDTEKFATKGEMESLSELLLQLRDELDSLGFRVDASDSEMRNTERRADQVEPGL